MIPICIPPVPMLKTFAWDQPMDLLLSHLVESIPGYKEFYLRKKAEKPQTFLTLDNSCHETGRGDDIRPLLKIAQELHVNELVLPDALFDSMETIQGFRRSLEYLKTQPPTGLRFMGVPQGKSFSDYQDCFDIMLGLYEQAQETHPRIFPYAMTIGISKDYHEDFAKEGGLHTILTDMVLPVKMKNSNVQIHLLGWPKPLEDLGNIRHRYGTFIRSTDSARMFPYALAEIDLMSYPTGQIPNYPKRPEGFFEATFTVEQAMIARRNCDFYEELVRGPMYRQIPIREVQQVIPKGQLSFAFAE